MCLCVFFVFKQKTAYEMRISDWSSDVCSSDLAVAGPVRDDLVGGAVVKGAGIGEDVLHFRLTIEQHVNGKRLRTEGAEVIERAVRAEFLPQTQQHAIAAVVGLSQFRQLA